MTEIKVRTVKSCFKWPRYLKMISVNCTGSGNMHFCVKSKLYPSERRSRSDYKLLLTYTVDYFTLLKTMRVDCEHRVFSSITAMKLFNKTNVPVLLETMMAIELQLVSFAVVMTLNHCSGVVHVSCIFMPNILY